MPTLYDPEADSMADFVERLGNIPMRRIRMKPTPGTATERDVIAAERRLGLLCELIDGTLVEKVMGAPESYVAIELATELRIFTRRNNLGFLLGPDGMTRLFPGLVRIPDLSFFSWEQVGKKVVPKEPICPIAPLLAVEVLSRGNTKGEIERKLKEYFLSGCRLVWLVDPGKRQVTVHTSPDDSFVLTESDSLTGGEVLLGFEMKLSDLFREVEPAEKKPKSSKGNRRKNGSA